MSEKTLRALSIVAGYAAVMEDDYSCTADLCDLGRETMDWIIENSNHQNLAHCDNDSIPCGVGSQQIKQEDIEGDVEGERILLELGILKSGQLVGQQVSE